MLEMAQNMQGLICDFTQQEEGAAAMRAVLVVYATREGHTKDVAEYLTARLETTETAVTVMEAKRLPRDFCPTIFDAVVVAASVHRQKHEAEMVRFVKQHAAELNQMLTAFISVSLSQAGAQDERAVREKRARSAADVRRMMDDFLAETHWRPTLVQPVAGALRYTKYNFVIRPVMKRIAHLENASTDTSRDHVFTKWEDVDGLAKALAERLENLKLSFTQTSDLLQTSFSDFARW